MKRLGEGGGDYTPERLNRFALARKHRLRNKVKTAWKKQNKNTQQCRQAPSGQ